MIMDIDWLKDFLTLAEHASFSRAAEARHVTQPAFSRRVRALEDWIGTPLFVRSAQGALLTAAGQAFSPLAADLLHSLEQARRQTLLAAEHDTTSLAIAATHALSFTFFPGWISRHFNLEASGKLNLISDTLQACEQVLLSGEVNFLLCHYRQGMTLHFDLEKFAGVRIGTDTLVAVSGPDNHGRPLWPVSDKARSPTRVLAYSPASGLGRILASLPAHPANTSATETIFTSHLAATLRAMARDQKGAAWLPMTLISEDLRQGTLVRAGSDATDVEIDIRLFRSPVCKNRAADALWQSLCED